MASDQSGVPRGLSEDQQGGEVPRNVVPSGGGSESSRVVRRNRGKSVTRWVQNKLRIRTSSKNEPEGEALSPTTQAAYLSSSMPFLDQAGNRLFFVHFSEG